MTMAIPKRNLALRLAPPALTVATGLVLSACGSTGGADASPIPSTGVPMAAREARGVKVADQSAPFPTTPSEQDPFGMDPFGNPHAPSVPTVSPLPQPPPPDPFAAPRDAPSATPPLTPPPPKPPPTGVPL